jgi:hypothetical protein
MEVGVVAQILTTSGRQASTASAMFKHERLTIQVNLRLPHRSDEVFKLGYVRLGKLRTTREMPLTEY